MTQLGNDVVDPPANVRRGTPLERTIAIVGVAFGFLFMVIVGIWALLAYRAWQQRRRQHPLFPWFLGCSFGGLLIGFGSALATFGFPGNDDQQAAINAMIFLPTAIVAWGGPYLLIRSADRREPPTSAPPLQRLAAPTKLARALQVVGLAIAATGVGLSVYVVISSPSDWVVRGSLTLTAVGAAIYFAHHLLPHADLVGQPPARPDAP